ncbi:MAG: TrkH family potassium uptake protein [Rhodobacteraceae bacterium]|nr:TrkH family potassium uptake protein [Paracoccaceae bacterium]
MIDSRPVGYVIGWLIIGLGLSMLIPMLVDVIFRNGQWTTFAISSAFTIFVGLVLVLATSSTRLTTQGTSLRETILITVCLYTVIPLFAAIPFVLGEPNFRIIDAYFESVSGLTTTGATVFSDIENLPEGYLLWRGILQWIGGILIIIIAMTVFPRLRIGGMQYFMKGNFETITTVIPQAISTARGISITYLAVSLLCFLAYNVAGLSIFDSLVHSMTTVATGGFGNYDSSFQNLGYQAEYVAIVFMILASIPFIRYLTIFNDSGKSLILDRQVQGFIGIILFIGTALTLWQMLVNGQGSEIAIRKALFNSISIMTGTGYVSADYNAWGSFPVAIFFLIGLIGGCAGSTSCSVKVFRYQVLFASLVAQIKKIYSPHAIIKPRYQGKNIPSEIMISVILFIVMFLFTLMVSALLLAMTGLDFMTSISGSAAALANIGPGLGDVIGPTGNYQSLGDVAKLILAITMATGRLELLAVFVILTLKFWQS